MYMRICLLIITTFAAIMLLLLHSMMQQFPKRHAYDPPIYNAQLAQ